MALLVFSHGMEAPFFEHFVAGSLAPVAQAVALGVRELARRANDQLSNSRITPSLRVRRHCTSCVHQMLTLW